ncbi:MAG: response regulator transcription factor, partial [Proteobacteria bacterium]
MMRATLKSVVVIDRHPIVRQGVRHLLEDSDRFVVVGDAGTAAEGFEARDATKADIVILDDNLPDAQGVASVQGALRGGNVAVVVLTRNDTPTSAASLLQAGASAFVSKAGPVSDLLSALLRVADGGIFVSAPSAPGPPSSSIREDLPPRVTAVLRLLVEGRSVHDIASSRATSW